MHVYTRSTNSDACVHPPFPAMRSSENSFGRCSCTVQDKKHSLAQPRLLLCWILHESSFFQGLFACRVCPLWFNLFFKEIFQEVTCYTLLSCTEAFMNNVYNRSDDLVLMISSNVQDNLHVLCMIHRSNMPHCQQSVLTEDPSYSTPFPLLMLPLHPWRYY